MIPSRRADAIVACFKSKTYCKWATENYLYELVPWDAGMVLRCGRIEDEGAVKITWTATQMFVTANDYLKIYVDDDMVIEILTEPEEEER